MGMEIRNWDPECVGTEFLFWPTWPSIGWKFHCYRLVVSFVPKAPLDSYRPPPFRSCEFSSCPEKAKTQALLGDFCALTGYWIHLMNRATMTRSWKRAKLFFYWLFRQFLYSAADSKLLRHVARIRYCKLLFFGSHWTYLGRQSLNWKKILLKPENFIGRPTDFKQNDGEVENATEPYIHIFAKDAFRKLVW